MRRAHAAACGEDNDVWPCGEGGFGHGWCNNIDLESRVCNLSIGTVMRT